MELSKKIEKERKQMLSDCWEYHNKLINGESAWRGRKITKDELADFLFDVDLTDWEDVGFFVGYLRALDDFAEWTNKLK